MAEGDLKAADEAVAPVAENVDALAKWRTDLAVRMEADTAISDWEKQVLTTVGGSSK